MSSNIRIEKVCKFCGDSFIAKTTVTKYCSDTCAKKAYKRRKKMERLEQSEIESLVDKLYPLLELQQKQFLNVLEAAELLGVSDTTIRTMIYEGRLKSSKLGSRSIIRRFDIDSLFS